MHKQPATREGEPPNCRTTAWVEWRDDLSVAGRRFYRITGESKQAVQAAITARMQTVEYAGAGGLASFIGPYRNGAGYLALGETIIEPFA